MQYSEAIQAVEALLTVAKRNDAEAAAATSELAKLTEAVDAKRRELHEVGAQITASREAAVVAQKAASELEAKVTLLDSAYSEKRVALEQARSEFQKLEQAIAPLSALSGS